MVGVGCFRVVPIQDQLCLLKKNQENYSSENYFFIPISISNMSFSVVAFDQKTGLFLRRKSSKNRIYSNAKSPTNWQGFISYHLIPSRHFSKNGKDCCNLDSKYSISESIAFFSSCQRRISLAETLTDLARVLRSSTSALWRFAIEKPDKPS